MAGPLPKPANDDADGLGRLKTLLFRNEAARLETVENTAAALDRRLGDAPRLEAATAEILVEAFQRAEVARHRDLAQAVAPVVVAAIRNEIKNSKDMMVEALYPLTGQLVVAAVSNAVREAMAAVNERLDALTSLDRWKLRLRARMSGQPVGELAMGDSSRTRLMRAWFLARGSGELLAGWSAGQARDDKDQLIGGLLAALSGFARDALGDGGDLRTLDFGGRDIHTRVSPTHIVACEFNAPLRAAQRASLDRDSFAWLEQFGRDGVANDAVFRDFIEKALARAAPARKKRAGWPSRLVIAFLAFGVAGLAVRAAIRGWREHEWRSALASGVESRPALAGYPLAISVDHAAGRVELRGLAPSNGDVDALASSLREAGGGYAVATKVGIVASGAALAGEIADARTAIAELGPRLDALGARIDALQRSAATTDQLAAARAEQAATTALLAATNDKIAAASEKISQAGKQVGDLADRVNTPRARVQALIDGFAIYFDGLKPSPRPGMDERLDALAAALKDTGLGIRIVGHTDETGSRTRNQEISKKRADAAADLLADRGVARDKIVTVGRAYEAPAQSMARGVGELNRRAVFELPYEGEVSP